MKGKHNGPEAKAKQARVQSMFESTSESKNLQALFGKRCYENRSHKSMRAKSEEDNGKK
jgi:hypothetical protein